ncbi:MAG TPA: hypothetical protein EYP36_03145 [Calditrichaeota bacterium]|nr:hypothetical protein [Calditrichota bacterium]
MNDNQSNLIWQETFKVRSYEINSEGRLSFQSLANYLMEAAFNHSYALKLSVLQLHKRGLTWVLSRLHVKVESYPRWMDRIVIETWPSGKNESYALRDFEVKDQNNNLIATATTSWMMMDIKTRRPVSLPDELKQLIHSGKNRAIDDAFDMLPQPQKVDVEKEFNVRLSDLDINQHVNFLNYIEWAIESVPMEIWREYVLSDLQVSYRAEAKLGDRAVVQSEQLGGEDKKRFIHDIFRDKDRKELTRLITCWHAITNSP